MSAYDRLQLARDVYGACISGDRGVLERILRARADAQPQLA
jgi:hypothetical protein